MPELLGEPLVNFGLLHLSHTYIHLVAVTRRGSFAGDAEYLTNETKADLFNVNPRYQIPIDRPEKDPPG